jgi:hypothetical protein
MNIKLTLGLCLFAGGTASAQAAPESPKRAPVCAEAVKVYTDFKQVPAPFDSVRIPPADGPIRVTNEEEAAAAELQVRKRAGSVGATGLVMTMEEVDDGSGMIRASRRVTGVFVRADSAAAQKACLK